jgi:hypothetical protein
MAVKKKKPQISSKPVARAKKKQALARVPEKPSKGFGVFGFDISTSSIAGAALGWDAILNKWKGPAFLMRRFGPDDDYFSRLDIVANAHDLIHDLTADLGILLNMDEIWIAQEEPFPAAGSFMKRGISNNLKQQAEMSGAFLGGLVRYGYRNIFQIGNHQWRQVVAHGLTDLGTHGEITIHHSKWRNAELALQVNCKPADSGKFRAWQWAHEVFEPWIVQQGGNPVPEFTHMIQSSKGKIPKPEKSKAKVFQPDDRYDALAIMDWMRAERLELLG